MIDSLYNIVKMIGDFISSFISGLKALVEALNAVSQVSSMAGFWMPTVIFSVFAVGVILSMVLRIIK